VLLDSMQPLLLSNPPKPDQIMVVGNGGTICSTIIEHDQAVAPGWSSGFNILILPGVIFSRQHIEGPFRLNRFAANTPDAPDVMVALRWNPKPNRLAYPGQITTDAARSAGQGSHATLSEFDVHNTFDRGWPWISSLDA